MNLAFRTPLVALLVSLLAVAPAAHSERGEQPEGKRIVVVQVSRGSLFLREAAQNSRFEIILGQLAQERGTLPAVQNFGAKMVTDHQALLEEIQRVAREERISLLPRRLSPEQIKLRRTLQSLSDEDFDRAYMSLMVIDHHAEIRDVQLEIARERNRNIRALALSALPILQEHLALAESVQDQVSAAQPASATPVATTTPQVTTTPQSTPTVAATTTPQGTATQTAATPTPVATGTTALP